MSRGVSCLHHLYHPCCNKKKQNGGSQVPAYPGRPENGCLTSVVVVVSCRENGALHSVFGYAAFSVSSYEITCGPADGAVQGNANPWGSDVLP